jgi:hypothetical protein
MMLLLMFLFSTGAALYYRGVALSTGDLPIMFEVHPRVRQLLTNVEYMTNYILYSETEYKECPRSIAERREKLLTALIIGLGQYQGRYNKAEIDQKVEPHLWLLGPNTNM